MNPNSVPQPLTGTEIKRGIAVRMTQGLPPDLVENLRDKIIDGLGKTCSLLPSSAYAKFKANWRLEYSLSRLAANWWVNYELDDFGRITRGGIGGEIGEIDDGSSLFRSGAIEEVPPDRFRRETDQPIPKPTELKSPEQEKSTFSRASRGSGKRREV